MAPYLFLVLARREYAFAFTLCLIAGLTDAFDGLIARRVGATSKFGAYLDPLADKVLLSGSFVMLALGGTTEKWLAVLVLGRDLLILLMVAGGYLFAKIRSFPPSIWGKMSTTAQIAFIAAVLLSLAGFVGDPIVIILKWLTAFLTGLSGLDYARRGLIMARRRSAMEMS